MSRLKSYLIALFALVCGTALAANDRLEPTLETHYGPWYLPGAPFVASLWQPGQAGERLQLRGRVLSTSGVTLADALLELWHTDALGNYPPLRASRRTKKNGSFGISTVLPGHNGGYRARHIHFVVSHPTHQQLVTRIFFKGDENIEEAPYPELAVFLEEGLISGQPVLFADIEFVLRPH